MELYISEVDLPDCLSAYRFSQKSSYRFTHEKNPDARLHNPMVRSSRARARARCDASRL